MRFLLLVLLGLSLGSCAQREPQVITKTPIPALLDRSELIRQGKEWDQVQNHYASLRQKIEQGEDVAKSTLELAQLFTIEARITGEHGHYYPAAQNLLDGLLENQDLDQDLRFVSLTTLAGVQLSQHHFQEALITGTEALQMNPYNAQIYGVLVDAYVELGSYPEAVAMADQMVAIRPDIRSYARISYLREIYGQVEEAIEAMQMAVLAGSPGSEEKSWAAYQLGQLYQRYGYLEQAQHIYNQILEERPDYPFAVAARGEIFEANSEWDRAEAAYLEAASIIPEFSFYESLALLYQKQGQAAKADSLLQEVLVMLADDVASGHAMDLEYAHLYEYGFQQLEKALNYTLEAYTQRPNNIDVNLRLAQLYQKMGKPAKAREHAQVAASTQSKHPDLLSLQADLASLSMAK